MQNTNTGYIVNIPLYYNGNLENLEKNIDVIINNPMFKTNRNIKILIGLNQKSGAITDDKVDMGVEKAQKLFAEKLKNKNIKVEVVNYQWQPMAKFSGPNYSEIRNKIFENEINKRFIKEFKEENFQNIFYLTLDPDSKVSEEIFEKVEKEKEDKFVPLVLTGTYEFEIEDVKFIKENGELNWEGFLSFNETSFDKNLKQEIAKRDFEFTKYSYNKITKENSVIKNNAAAIEHIIEYIDKGKLKFKDEINSKIFFLNEKYQKIKTKENISDEEIKDIFDLENQIGLENLNIKKSVSGSSILYPAEPVLFISLYQKYKDKEVDFAYMIEDAFENNNIRLWGDYAHTQEGETMLSNVRNIWRNYTQNHKEQKFEKREYIKVVFDYKTQIPERSLKIDAEFLNQLPKNISELLVVLNNEETTRQLHLTFGKIFSEKVQSSLTDKFLEQRKRYLTGTSKEDSAEAEKSKPSRFGSISGQAIYSTFKDYFLERKEVIVGVLIQDILNNIKNQS